MVILDEQKHNVKTEAYYCVYIAIHAIDFIVSPMQCFPFYKENHSSILSLNV